MLVLTGIVIGRISRGVIKPTEASGIVAIGALLILVIKSGINLSIIKSSLVECLCTTSMVFTINKRHDRPYLID
jgi:TRAP-type mannitol/chloroaromatic compound transport system permease large subunit